MILRQKTIDSFGRDPDNPGISVKKCKVWISCEKCGSERIVFLGSARARWKKKGNHHCMACCTKGIKKKAMTVKARRGDQHVETAKMPTLEVLKCKLCGADVTNTPYDRTPLCDNCLSKRHRVNEMVGNRLGGCL